MENTNKSIKKDKSLFIWLKHTTATDGIRIQINHGLSRSNEQKLVLSVSDWC